MSAMPPPSAADAPPRPGAMRMQKLFVLTITLKVGASFLGWRLHMPWSLGFAAPLAIMAAYVVAGLRRGDADVSDEKFGDSCYYLGFIFTLSSIIFSLFDLPDIGTRMPDIAVRLGAAMVSTMAGLVVRVYLVGFQHDDEDAVRASEQAVIEAARRFQAQLQLTTDRFADYGAQVDRASRETIERVRLELERLAMDHAARLGELVTGLLAKHQDVLDGRSDDLRETSDRLSTAVGEVVAQAGAAARALSESSDEMTLAMRRLRNKALSSEEILEAIQRLASQQAVMEASARGQVEALAGFGRHWAALEARLAVLVAHLETGGGATHPPAAAAPGGDAGPVAGADAGAATGASADPRT